MSLSKQEVQNIVENAKNRIMERMVSRQDMQSFSDSARDRIMNYAQEIVQLHHQQTFERANVRQAQLLRYMSHLDTRITSLEGEIKSMRRLLQRIAANTEAPQRMRMPLQPEQTTDAERTYTGYAYRPR